MEDLNLTTQNGIQLAMVPDKWFIRVPALKQEFSGPITDKEVVGMQETVFKLGAELTALGTLDALKQGYDLARFAVYMSTDGAIDYSLIPDTPNYSLDNEMSAEDARKTVMTATTMLLMALIPNDIAERLDDGEELRDIIESMMDENTDPDIRRLLDEYDEQNPKD